MGRWGEINERRNEIPTTHLARKPHGGETRLESLIIRGHSLECRWEIFGTPLPTVRYYGADIDWLTGTGVEPLPRINLVTLLWDFRAHA